MAPHRKAVVVGISGCSSSGKTTLGRLLRDIFPHTFVLHEDDFYRPETELPQKHGLLDWDCAESLSIPSIVKSLDHIHKHGIFPVSLQLPNCRANHGVQVPENKSLIKSQPDLNSKEDQNSVGPCPVPDSIIDSLKAQVKKWAEPGHPGHGVLDSSREAVRLCIFDGFLLYSKSMASVQPQMDIKLFLRVSYAKAKARREARSGYVTLEGFWQDPPDYVDKVVWPNYVEAHKWMFEDDDVEGKLRDEVVEQYGIQCQEGGVDLDMTTTLKWAVDLLMKELPVVARA